MSDHQRDKRDNRVELSAASLKFSYVRFLADAASGLLVLFLALCAYHLKLITPSRGTWFQYEIGHENKILLLALSSVLSVPLGLVLNATGWFLFGCVQTRMARRWFREPPPWLARSTQEGYPVELLTRTFGLTVANLHSKGEFYANLLGIFQPQELDEFQHIQGLKRLLRSSAVIWFGSTLFGGALAVCKREFLPFLLLFVFGALAFASLRLLSLLEFYQCISVLNRVYLFCLPRAAHGSAHSSDLPLNPTEVRFVEQIAKPRGESQNCLTASEEKP